MPQGRFQFVSLYSPEHGRRGRLAMTALLTALGALLAIGAILAMRRLTGQATEPLPLVFLATTAAGAFALIEGGRRTWRRLWPTAETPRQRQLDLAVGWLGSAAFVLLAVGCVYPGYYTTEWLVWLPLLIADQFFRQTFFERGSVYEPLTDRPQLQRLSTEPAPAAFATSLCNDGELAEEVLQQLFRVRDEQGIEAVYGSVAAEFVPGQRHAVLHVGFCPPLQRTPTVEADCCAGPDARVKVLQSYAHGVRMEVRLAEPARQPCRVTVDLAALPAADEQTATA